MRYSTHLHLFFLFCICNVNLIAAQDPVVEKKPVFFIEPEYLAGFVYPNHSDFPETGGSHTLALNLGWFQTTTNKKWASFYNFPFTGITISRANPGNRNVFGDQYSVVPYITFNVLNRINHSVFFKIALGGSYFTRFYDASENPDNLVIGSHFTWSFQSFMYYSVYTGSRLSLNLGAGYMHNSNGHIQLPNVGLNQAAIGISVKYFTHPIHPGFHPRQYRVEAERKKRYYAMVRTGIGMHEYGSATGPIGGEKRLVNSVTVSAGMLLKEHIRVGAGLAGRIYHQYHHHILNPADSLYSDRPWLNASNLYFFINCEFLTGHIGMDIAGGLNLYKPYFKRHYNTLEGEIDFDYWLKKLFNTRIALNYYLINTQKKPRNNIFVGASINANFGQADFSGICIGVTHNLSRP
ncbi:MAG: acyloxyacyl hydrolase [Bacteroidales bacterium]|nr:acyloxyacyl hydrolase [Bacteroidales bacterium]